MIDYVTLQYLENKVTKEWLINSYTQAIESFVKKHINWKNKDSYNQEYIEIIWLEDDFGIEKVKYKGLDFATIVIKPPFIGRAVIEFSLIKS